MAGTNRDSSGWEEKGLTDEEVKAGLIIFWQASHGSPAHLQPDILVAQ